MTWGENYYSGPGYVGRCPECEGKSGTCYDELCEDCEKHAPVVCSDCGEKYEPELMHGSTCFECFEFQQQIKRDEVESIWSAEH